MKKLFIIVGLVGILCGCTQPDTATRALESAGYTKIQLDGYSIFGCGKDDTFHDKFTAIGTNGKVVHGAVCGGWFKGATIRLD